VRACWENSYKYLSVRVINAVHISKGLILDGYLYSLNKISYAPCEFYTFLVRLSSGSEHVSNKLKQLR